MNKAIKYTLSLGAIGLASGIYYSQKGCDSLDHLLFGNKWKCIEFRDFDGPIYTTEFINRKLKRIAKKTTDYLIQDNKDYQKMISSGEKTKEEMISMVYEALVKGSDINHNRAISEPELQSITSNFNQVCKAPK